MLGITIIDDRHWLLYALWTTHARRPAVLPIITAMNLNWVVRIDARFIRIHVNCYYHRRLNHRSPSCVDPWCFLRSVGASLLFCFEASERRSHLGNASWVQSWLIFTPPIATERNGLIRQFYFTTSPEKASEKCWTYSLRKHKVNKHTRVPRETTTHCIHHPVRRCAVVSSVVACLQASGLNWMFPSTENMHKNFIPTHLYTIKQMCVFFYDAGRSATLQGRGWLEVRRMNDVAAHLWLAVVRIHFSALNPSVELE